MPSSINVSRSLNSDIYVGALPATRRFWSVTGATVPLVLSGIVLKITEPSSAYPILASNGDSFDIA